ncbi:hypothetical protein [Streptomyces huiliensis]|uniref:hypothetical protein n=1 Tax=Streptomyces huiliensis TaxID=2876027 RepID=UPI001CBCDAF4|nr:hypothetical protein [Streptomyces huiliensis]MBZ4318775.1 hypothetical protein [Streptomyces huiliensis]
MIGNRGARVALGFLALLTAVAGGIPAAKADGHSRARLSMDCTGQENITYGPGLGLSSAGSAKVSVDGTYHCRDGSGHTSTATYHTEGKTGGGCLLLSWNQSKEVGVPVRTLSPAANGGDLAGVSPVWVSPGPYGCGG